MPCSCCHQALRSCHANRGWVSPDILPPGSVKIEEVWIDGRRHTDFDAEQLTVKLPKSDLDLRVKVLIAPASLASTFTAVTDIVGDTATVTLYGVLGRTNLATLQAGIAKVIAAQPRKVILEASDLTSIDAIAVRALVFAKQKLDIDVDVYVVGAKDQVLDVFHQEELDDEINLVPDLASIPKS